MGRSHWKPDTYLELIRSEVPRYDELQEHGLTTPAGCGHAVGIAGLTLGAVITRNSVRFSSTSAYSATIQRGLGSGSADGVTAPVAAGRAG